MKNEHPNRLFSLEAEQEVLSAVLKNPECLDDAIEIAEVADFYSPQHQRILAELVKQYSDGPNADAVTVLAGLESQEDCAYGIEIFNGSMGQGYRNVKAYAHIVAERAKLRRLKTALQESMDNLAESHDSSEAIEFAQSRMIELEGKNFETEIQATNHVLKRMVQNLDERWRNREAGILGGLPTGLSALDERWSGMRDGHLIVLAARPSMGKSALAMQIAQNTAVNQESQVLVFSLEMPSEELYERMVASQGNLPYTRIRNGTMIETDWPKLSLGVAKLKDAPIRTIDTPSLHINQVRAYARKAHRSAPLRLIVVDHINIMRGDGQNREREVASISGGLKALAKELNCPVLALCQLNRGVEQRANKRPMMSDLRESGAIEQDADIVAFMYRDDYYNPESQRKGVVEVLTRKFRGGEVGDDYLANRLEVMRIDDLAPGYQAPEPEPAPEARVFSL